MYYHNIWSSLYFPSNVIVNAILVLQVRYKESLHNTGKYTLETVITTIKESFKNLFILLNGKLKVEKTLHHTVYFTRTYCMSVCAALLFGS